jgi:hypothetical protein
MHLALSGAVNFTMPKLTKEGDFAMNGPYREPGVGVGLIILLVILYILLNPIAGPVDDAAVAAIGGYQVLKRL